MNTPLPTVVIKPITRKVVDVAGFLSKYKKSRSVSVEEMDKTVAQYISRKAPEWGCLQKRMQNKDRNIVILPE